MKKIIFLITATLSLAVNMNAQSFPEMIKVEGGTFLMGDNTNTGQIDEKPVHQVTLSTYWIAKTETTVLQWKVFCEATRRELPQAPSYGWTDHSPITNINWYDATAYVEWLSLKTGKKYRIPTEAEWEFAARGGNLSKENIYSGSNDPKLVAWFNENSNNQTHEVAQKQSNELGLYDMTGNVWEWTNDIYAPYDTASLTNPTGGQKGTEMVFKGGGIIEPAIYNKISMRGQSSDRFYKFRDLGLRVVCE